jgi:hypothetical protein
VAARFLSAIEAPRRDGAKWAVAGVVPVVERDLGALSYRADGDECQRHPLRP